MAETDKHTGAKNGYGTKGFTENYDSCDERVDGVPSIERSISNGRTNKDRMSTSKFLLNEPDDEDERMSNITDIVCE